ncbi:MAG: hypothetical protein V3V92_05345 [Candidatus Hydrothermarchaeales archaeon]
MIFLIFSSLFLALPVYAEAQAQLSIWEVSVDFVPPEEEHLQLFLEVHNKGTEKIQGIELSVAAAGLEYIETETLSLGEEETSDKLDVATRQDGGTSVATVMFPKGLEQGDSKRVLVNFNAKGLLHSQGEGYAALLKFDEPMIILENRDKVTLNMDTGSFRVHIPEGFLHTGYDPMPWREIWQGVSGFKAHFILIFDGGTPLTTAIKVSFEESRIIKRAVEIHGRMLELESAKELPQEQLDEANQRVTEAANYVILGNDGLAELELDKAESILTGKPVTDIVFQSTETKGSSRRELYILGIVFVVLVLVSLIFGKKIVSE